MLFLFLPSLISSAIFGIDYGSEYIKVSMAHPNRGIHVTLNQQSKRLSPSYFAIWNISNPSNSHLDSDSHFNISDLDSLDWSYLDRAKSHSFRFPKNAVNGLTPVNRLRNGLRGQEIIALIIRHLIQTVDEGKWKPEDASIVISVEPKLPREERVAIAEAISLSNATLTAIVDSSTAAAHVYALERLSFFDSKGKTVVFIDIGATHTWTAVYNFSISNNDPNPNVDELAVDFNYTLGGNLMDNELAEFLMKKFYDQYKIEITSPRKKRQFLDEARRAKELLTVNKDVTIKIDDVVEDYGLNYHLSRDEFESLIQHFNESLRELYFNVVKKAGLNISQIDSIELIGGITRVPFVIQSLMEVSGMAKLNRTMNSDEAIALGAGYIGASRSTSFLIKKVNIRPFAGVNVTLHREGQQIKELFNETSRTTIPQIYNTTVGDLFQSNFSLECNGVELLTFNFTERPENITDEMNAFVLFFFDAYTMPNLYYAYANRTTLLKPEIYPASWRMNLSDYYDSMNFIRRMDEITNERHYLQHVMNDYESYIYSIQDKMEYDKIFKRVLSEKDVEDLKKIIEEHHDWLFNDNSNQNERNATTFTERLKELHAATADAEFRAEQLPKRAPSFMKLNITLNNVYNVITKTWPIKKPWINGTSQWFNVWFDYNSTSQWYKEKYEEQSKLNDTQMPIVKYQDIDVRRQRLETLFDIADKMAMPTPTPTPSPTPSDSLSDDSSDQQGQEQSEELPELNDKPIPKKRIDDTGYENNEL